MVRIALDAMGGDFAPGATVEGALLAARELGESHQLQLVGREGEVQAELDRVAASDGNAFADARKRIICVDASDVIGMAEKPAAAVRGKPDSSMVIGLRMQKEGTSDGFVSAGNTGAQMAASMMLLKLHPTVTRPAIVTHFPTATQVVAVLDSGANVDCSPAELLHFARLGSLYAQIMLGRTNPRVALLNIGEEAEKGNAVVKETYQLLTDSGLNFVGNVEGRDLPFGRIESGPLDVVVCDGFVGNVVLKVYEAMAPMILARLESSLGMDREKMRDALSDLDYSEHGGALLLGVKGVSVIAHGKSSARAIKNAIRVAARAAERKISDHVGRSLTPAAESA